MVEGGGGGLQPGAEMGEKGHLNLEGGEVFKSVGGFVQLVVVHHESVVVLVGQVHVRGEAQVSGFKVFRFGSNNFN